MGSFTSIDTRALVLDTRVGIGRHQRVNLK